MQLIGLLNWYDEEPAMLARCVKSLAGVVDHLVAVDGAYKLFPNGQPRSPKLQVDTLKWAAKDAGFKLTIHQPEAVWENNELEKKQFLFDLAESVSTEDDWYLHIDADETLNPGFPKEQLETARESVALLGFQHDMNRHRSLYGEGIRRAFRAHRGIWVGNFHAEYRLPDGAYLSAKHGIECVPALDLQPAGLTHHKAERSEQRHYDKWFYRRALEKTGADLSYCLVCGDAATVLIHTDWNLHNGRIEGIGKEFCSACAVKERKKSKRLAIQLGVLDQLQKVGLVE